MDTSSAPKLLNRDMMAYATAMVAEIMSVTKVQAPTLAEDGVTINWAVSIQQEMVQHPLTQEVTSRPVLMFNGWVGPFPAGQVIITATPTPLYEVDDSHLIRLVVDSVVSLEVEYLVSKPQLDEPATESQSLVSD